MIIEDMIYLIGMWFVIIVCFGILALLTALVARFNIRATKYFVEMLGGWKVFYEFQQWNAEQKRKK